MDEVYFMDEMDANETHQAGEGESRHVNLFSCASAVVCARLLPFPGGRFFPIVRRHLLAPCDDVQQARRVASFRVAVNTAVEPNRVVSVFFDRQMKGKL